MKIFKKIILAAVISGLAQPMPYALAEDIDIYAANTGPTTNPNILVVIDNSANWASANQHWPGGIKQGEAELSALRSVVSELSSDINVGLMLFTPGSGDAYDGGYIRYHIRQMTSTNKSALQELLGNPSGCTNGSNSLNSTPNCLYQNFNDPSEKVGTAKLDYSGALFEVFKYFGGYTSPALANANTAGTPVDNTHFGALRYSGDPDVKSDAAAYSGGSSKPDYNSPLNETNSCAKNYVIFIGNGYPTKDSPSTLLTGVGGDATQLAAPDFTTTSGTIQTLLSTGSYTSQAACEAAATTTYGDSYNSYSCSVASTTTSSTTLQASTGCGIYASAAACEEAAATNFPGYSSYTCNATASSCTGSTTNLGTSTCGQYASVAACQAGAASQYGSNFSSYTCSNQQACGSGSTSLGISSCGEYATASACQSALATRFPGYNSYTCALNSTCNSSLSSNSCFASASACQTSTLTANPGYNSISCSSGSATGCNGVTTTCGDKNDYNTTDECNAGGASRLPGYATYTCAAASLAACGTGNNDRQWTITGSNNSQQYSTITATGSKWNMVGNTTGGSTFSIVGNGGSSYTVLGNTVATTYNVYGSRVVTTSVPTGTFTGTVTNNADEWARFLNKTDVSSAIGKQSISTYTIDVFKDAQDASQTKLMLSMARAGGGKYFTASDEGAIKDALRKIFSEIQSVNSVFASSSLPVSVNTQGTYLNQVFMGMFRPDGGAKPRWLGNLKQYQFQFFNGTLKLADKNGDEAISATTGFITPCADSFWTTDTGTYWNYSGSTALGNCTADSSAFPTSGSISFYSDAPDGDVVEKGGAAQRLRGVSGSTTSSTNYSTRNVKTCDGSTATSCTSFTDFNTANSAITTASLGVNTSTDRDNLINWVRGQDIDDENVNTVQNEMRPSVHGGVIHSQPAVVDYGGATGVIAYYGADDGVLHAVDAGQSNTEGNELWGFIAPETYSRLFRLKDNGANTALINFPGIPASLAPASKDYFFDGSISIYQNTTTVWLYASMRRGGRAIYAFDVSTPASPTLKWTKGCFTNSTSNDSKCSSGWTNIGQTWSKPQVAFLSGYVDAANKPKPVLVFGGGYDTCEDTNSQTRCTTTPRKGANIWFVDADTGNIIQTYPTNYSVPGDIFLLKNNLGYVTYAYAADTGGYVYRINVGTYDGTTLNSWTSNSSAANITIANLSETNQARKFIFGPDVVQYAGFNVVSIGSGDREHPLENSYACGSYSTIPGDFVTNQFFAIKDTTSTYPGTPITVSALTDVTNNLNASISSIAASGWRFELSQCEQVVNKPLTIAGKVFFGTNLPNQTAVSSCSSNLGEARGYAVNFLTGSSLGATTRYKTYAGGGLPPSPVAGVVDVNGEKVPFLIGGQTPSPLEGGKVEINPTGPRQRIYWYLETD